MRTYIISSLLLFVSFVVIGQAQELKISAEYISENKISVKIENLTNDTVSMLISPEMGFSQSEMMLTFIKNKNDTVDHYFEPLYDKYILRIPPRLIHEKIFLIEPGKIGTDIYINIFLRYIVHSIPNKRKHVRKEIRLERNKKPQNKVIKTQKH